MECIRLSPINLHEHDNNLVLTHLITYSNSIINTNKKKKRDGQFIVVWVTFSRLNNHIQTYVVFNYYP